jgi:hypothetical protein
MEASQAAKSSSADPGALQIGQNDCAGIANHDVLYISATVYQDSNLSIYFTRYLSEMAGKFLGNDFMGRNSSLIKLLQPVDLAWLQALQVTLDAYGTLLRTKAFDPRHDLTSKREPVHGVALD